MTRIGYLLLTVGFLGATLVASLHTEAVNWLYFGVFALLGTAGVFVLQHGRKLAAADSALLDSDRATLRNSIDHIEKNLADLEKRKEDIPPHDMRFEIDKLFREDLRNFAEARDSLKNLYGLSAFADVMSAFAAGERYINRIWSASADGYVDEVLLYVKRAHEQFVEARQKLDRAEAGRQG